MVKSITFYDVRAYFSRWIGYIRAIGGRVCTTGKNGYRKSRGYRELEKLYFSKPE